jgi:hypothetical protein
MKTGTFTCWLFGHKFYETALRYNIKAHNYFKELIPTTACTRCGEDKE